MISERIFRAYDIRGVYGVDLDEETASRIGRSFSVYLGSEGKEVIVGRDVRLSGEALENALIEGLLSGGCFVEDIGIVTTPVLYFSTVFYQKDGGIMVTASHNPPEWNGFKILTKKGFISEGMGMEEIKKNAISGQSVHASMGKLKKNTRVLTDYEDYVLQRTHLKRGLRGVFDAGNGSCSLLIPKLYEDAGVNVVAMNSVPDGRFPVHPPDPTKAVLEELGKRVLKERADFGVALDGDGDRCAFVDEKGRSVPTNSILIILAEHYLAENRGASVVYELSCSMSVEEAIRAHGGKPILSRVGHTYIHERMLQEKAVFGGELSGHFYFSELYGLDDALFASLKVAEVLSRRSGVFSDIVDSIPQYPMYSKSLSCPDEKKFQIVEALKEEFQESGYNILTIDGIKLIDPDGWFLIRPSNTQPQIRLTVEAKTKEKLEELAKSAEKRLLERIQT